MKERYTILPVTAKNETSKAFMCSFTWEKESTVFSNLWIPLSVIHEEYHNEIEEACEGDTIEIAIADWWLNQQI